MLQPVFGAHIKPDLDGVTRVFGLQHAKAVRKKSDGLNRALKDLPPQKVMVQIRPGLLERREEFTGKKIRNEDVLTANVVLAGKDGIIRSKHVTRKKGWHSKWMIMDEPLVVYFHRIKKTVRDMVATYGVQPVKKK